MLAEYMPDNNCRCLGIISCEQYQFSITGYHQPNIRTEDGNSSPENFAAELWAIFWVHSLHNVSAFFPAYSVQCRIIMMGRNILSVFSIVCYIKLLNFVWQD